MKLVDIGNVCFDAEGVDAFYPATAGHLVNTAFYNYHGDDTPDQDPSTMTVVDVNGVRVLLVADYATVKVAMQIALRQTIGD